MFLPPTPFVPFILSFTSTIVCSSFMPLSCCPAYNHSLPQTTSSLSATLFALHAGDFPRPPYSPRGCSDSSDLDPPILHKLLLRTSAKTTPSNDDIKINSLYKPSNPSQLQSLSNELSSNPYILPPIPYHTPSIIRKPRLISLQQAIPSSSTSHNIQQSPIFNSQNAVNSSWNVPNRRT